MLAGGTRPFFPRLAPVVSEVNCSNIAVTSVTLNAFGTPKATLFPIIVSTPRLAILSRVTLPSPIVNSGKGAPTVLISYVISPSTSPQINLISGAVVPTYGTRR